MHHFHKLVLQNLLYSKLNVTISETFYQAFVELSAYH